MEHGKNLRNKEKCTYIWFYDNWREKWILVFVEPSTLPFWKYMYLVINLSKIFININKFVWNYLLLGWIFFVLVSFVVWNWLRRDKVGKEHVRSISMYGCSSMVSCASFTKWCLLAWSELYILHLMACVRAFPPYTFFTSLPCRWLMVILEFLFCGPSDRAIKRISTDFKIPFVFCIVLLCL